ncbi:hypothetical protein RU93_GL001159 [Enterococcus aquimarinus]|uniref:Uncharacterized protein n=1 Tax=Enterococcus aquimarinus TaxID=328396 RepID=A0A1L8QWP7_9ENTE|nr:hypothetical protein RU93_GL001159 [Enterococcus aquimarinus]
MWKRASFFYLEADSPLLEEMATIGTNLFSMKQSLLFTK